MNWLLQSLASARGTLIAGAVVSSAAVLAWNSHSSAQSDFSTTTKKLDRILRKVTSLEHFIAKDVAKEGIVDVVLGAQWGDEGKGKLVDMLSGEYDVCARVAGGSNAGHTIVVDGVKYKFHLVPSGILSKTTTSVVGNGVVVHIPSLLQELEELEAAGVNYDDRIFLSDRAHIVFDMHQTIDGMREAALGKNKIGTTKKGIGPAYATKMARNGLRLGDLRFMDDFEARLRDLHRSLSSQYPTLDVDIEKEVQYYRDVARKITPMITDTIALTHDSLKKNKRILVEGANATMLDIDFGTYPYVTSSNPSIGSVCTGLGVAPRSIRSIWGTVKAYCTRVGDGPFPTEQENDVGERLRSVGGEFGTTTGRPRRCGWLDVPQMRFSAQVNGFTALNLTKLDVLTGLDEIKIGVAYKYKGTRIENMPSNLQVLSEVEVEYESMPSWTEDISKCTKFEDLPENAQDYVLRVEELIGCYIRWIGVGAGRDATIDRGVLYSD